MVPFSQPNGKVVKRRTNFQMVKAKRNPKEELSLIPPENNHLG